MHRVPVARSGLVELDRGAVSVDADRFRSLVVEAESLIEAGDEDEALRVLLRADDLWRAGPAAWEELGDPDARTPFGQARDGLIERRRHLRELAGRLGLERPGGIPPNRLLHWTRDGEAPPSLWHARTRERAGHVRHGRRPGLTGRVDGGERRGHRAGPSLGGAPCRPRDTSRRRRGAERRGPAA